MRDLTRPEWEQRPRMTPPARIRLRLLGSFALAQDGEPAELIETTSRKAMALVAYLAMQPEYSASREALATLLWGNRSDRQARHSLRQALASLRRELPWPHLFVIDKNSVRLQAGNWSVDAREFDALTKSSGAADLVRAGQLFRGEFLAGFDLDEEGFDEWLRDQRQRIELAANRLCESYATRMNLENGGDAIAFVERLVAIDPLREDRRRYALMLYARHRGRNEALSHAAALADLLRRELGAEPEPETRGLIEDIRSGAFGPAQPAAPVAPALIAPRQAAVAAAEPQTESEPSIDTPDVPAPSPGAAPARGRHLSSILQRRPSRTLSAGLAAVAVVIAAIAGVLMLNRSLPAHVGDPARSVSAVAREPAADPWRSPRTNAGATDAARPRRSIIAIAVLPFRTYGDAAGSTQLMADMITDDLINLLSRVGTIRVISRQTVRSYGSRPIDVAKIGEQLGVRYVLEGTMRTQGDRLRVNVELINPATRLPVWSARIERDASDQQAVQMELAGRLATELNFEVIALESRRRSKDADADALAYHGWAALWSSFANSGLDRFRKAEALFRQALDLDPGHPSAQLGMAAYHANLGAQRLVTDAAAHLDTAARLLQEIIRQYPSNGGPHFFMGMVHGARGNLPEAIEEFERAIEFNPSHASAHAHLGNALARLGRPAEGIEHLRYATRLSPRDPNLAYWYEFVGNAQLELGRYQEAIEDFRHSSEINASYLRSWAGLAAAHALAGHAKEARAFIDKLAALAPDTPPEQLADRFGRSKKSRLYEGLHLALREPS